MAADNRCLVIENDPTDDVRRLGEWLTTAGLDLYVLRPHAGDPLPPDLAGYVALVVLGGAQNAYLDPDGQPGEPWFPALETLLRKAVRGGVVTLGVCLGAQLLATAHAGRVAPSAAGPHLGARLVAKRDAAESDPLFAALPMLPDVIQWHYDEVVDLPAGAVLLAASTNHPVQAFRLGASAWGIQFHVECDTAMVSRWAANDTASLARLGLHPEEVLADVDAIMDDLFEAWQPFAYRFAAAALGKLTGAAGAQPGPAAVGRELPLLGR